MELLGAPPEVVVVGTCTAMCSARELAERQSFMEINPLEAEPGTEGWRHPKGSPALAVKRYARPAAGRALPSAEEVRPLDVLRRTTEHLISLVDNPYAGTYAFVADRLRAVVQDLVVQDIHDVRAAWIYERVVRFHALSALRHAMEEDGKASGFSAYHNHELMSKALVSLAHIYAHAGNDGGGGGGGGGGGATRADFHAFYLLMHASDPLLAASHVRTLPPKLQRSRPVMHALAVLRAAGSGDGLGMLQLIHTLPLAPLGCALHAVPRARELGVAAMRRTYLKQEALPASWLCSLLSLPADPAAARQACAAHGLELVEPAEGKEASLEQLAVRTTPAPPPAPAQKPADKAGATAPKSKGASALALMHTPALAEWRAEGCKMAPLLAHDESAWPQPPPGAADGGQAPADPAEGAGGDDELLALMGTLRQQINASPDFLRDNPPTGQSIFTMAGAAADGGSAGDASGDDNSSELATALKDMLSMLGGADAGAGPSTEGAGFSPAPAADATTVPV